MACQGNVGSPIGCETWPIQFLEDFQTNQFNGCVGTRLLTENDRVRVWEVRLQPGQHLHFHRHVLDYVWTALTPGRAQSRQNDGVVVELNYVPGDTKHYVYSFGEYKVHNLENIGDTELNFITVEFLHSANSPLPIPDKVRAGDMNSIEPN